MGSAPLRSFTGMDLLINMAIPDWDEHTKMSPPGGRFSGWWGRVNFARVVPSLSSYIQLPNDYINMKEQ